MAYITFQPNDYFNTKLYTGTGSSNAQTGVGFQPDWLWIKDRDSSSNSHVITDAIRGTNKIIFSDNNGAETTDANRVTSFDSDGFTVGTDGSTNTNTNDYVAWNWRASGTSGSSNSDGSITSTVSANTTAGFSIVTYTGTGANATVGHGLGSAPGLILFKQRSATQKWIVHHQSLGATKSLHLDTTEAEQTSTFMNDTAPTSSVFSLGTIVNNNTSGATYVAYCFAEKKGFSKFGSFTGNGSTDGPFVYTGFKPAWVMIKASSRSTDNWVIVDSKRSTLNPADDALLANTSGGTDTGYKRDFLSNGFKIRESGANQNGSGHTFTYMAFAEEPLVSSNNIPATAR